MPVASDLACFDALMVASSLMEKRRPTYDLEGIKLAIGSVDTLAMTVSALREAAALGFNRYAIVETILGIERRMFFKSMTTFGNHRVWQDVYHVPARGLTLYVKFQADVVTEFRVSAFKEK
jgi:motility quorum-sensing regulator/GCU-specific mRNA interferase toxin